MKISHRSSGVITIAALILASCQPLLPPPTPHPASLSAATAATTVASTIADCKSALGSPAAGEYEVVITLSGIGVFERRDSDGVMKVRMPNGASGRPQIKDVATGAVLRQAIHPHVAYVLADVATAKPIIDAGTALHPAFYEGNCYKYYPLDGHVITVDDASAPMTINTPLCFSDASDGKLCPNATTEGSMRWLPSIQEIRDGTPQTPDPRYFEDDPDPGVISGLVHVDRGYLETVVTLDKVWAFRKSATNLTEYTPQAIAQEVRWHMRGTGSEFVLRLKKKNGTEIRLPFTPVNGLVSIFIANSPSDDTGPVRTITVAADHHFPLHYEFIENFDPREDRIPYRSNVQNCAAGTVSGSPTLKVCDPDCPRDPHCPIAVTVGSPIPSGLNCGGTRWP